MVGQMLVAHCVWVRFPSFNPMESWVSGLYQQFTKLPAQKVREFESHTFRKMPVWRNWHTQWSQKPYIVGSSPTTGTKNITESIWYSKKLSVYLYKFFGRQKCSVGLGVRSHPFHGCSTGSNPVPSTNVTIRKRMTEQTLSMKWKLLKLVQRSE